MKTKILMKFLLAVVVLALGIGPAQAAPYTLDLTGTVSNATTNSYDSGGTHYDNWTLNLDGLSPFVAFQGDSIFATITLNSSVTIPASVSNTWLYLGLYGNNSSGFDTETKATTTLYNGGVAGISQTDTIIMSQDWLPAGAVLFPPDNTAPFTFDKVIIDYSITKIGSGGTDSLELIGATLYAQGQSPSVPEPTTMLLLGCGLVGLAGARRKFKK